MPKTTSIGSDSDLHLHHPISITPLLWRFQSSSSSSNLDHSIEDPQKESVLFHRRSKRRRADREREEVGDGFKDDFSLDRVECEEEAKIREAYEKKEPRHVTLTQVEPRHVTCYRRRSQDS
ncbi:hypothetical protein F2Q70_00000946 [Brassica cretica]|uniref:Uncharacterized protein n=1 Tax=Brassica cretica TaxID=69181 RepID=A0A8S9IMA0_BRACR|nr:hypothetical protein F2Q70_00000946 [Brassica cretica]